MNTISIGHSLAVQIALFHGKAMLRDHDPRHRVVIDQVLGQVSGPALALADTLKRLGRTNAVALGYEPKMVDRAIRAHCAAAL